MIYELPLGESFTLPKQFVRPSISLAIRDSHDQDMEFDGAKVRLKQTGFAHQFRYRYSNHEVAMRHYLNNLPAIEKISFRGKWTAFWVFRRGSMVTDGGMLHFGFQQDVDAIMFKMFWNKSNVPT